MSTPFALNLAAAPLVSGLPVAPQDLSTGAIDPPALSELVSRSATFESKPIAIPECARKVPLDERPKIRNDIQIWDYVELAKSVFTTFGIKGVLDVHVGPHYKIDWKQVRKMPERYPVREGRSKRDHGKMVELLSDDCSDASEQEEEEEPDEMIDDFDTEEELAAAARKAAKKARKE